MQYLAFGSPSSGSGAAVLVLLCVSGFALYEGKTRND